MSSLGAEEALSRSKVRLRQHSPFFAVLTLFANYRFDARVEIAETNGRDVLLNEAVLLALDDDQRIGLILHVTLHAALQHPSRMRGREPHLWNIACDVMVNYIMRTQTPFPPPPGTYEAKHLDRNLVPETAESVYEWLQRHYEVATRLQEGALFVEASGPGHKARSDAPQSEALPTTLRKSTMASALATRFGSKNAASPATPESARETAVLDIKALRDIRPQADRTQQELLQQHWNAALFRAREHEEARRQGTDPADWLRELKAASEPQLDWRVLLSRFVIQTPTDFAGFDRRFLHRGLYIESLEQETVAIAVGIDTSGSMSAEDLGSIAAELEAIVSVYPHIQCSLYYCDAALHGPYELNAGGPLPSASGGGGTDFRPFFAHLDEMRHTQMTALPSAAIYFTDGLGDFPDEPPPYPTMWVVLPGGARSEEFPFGEVIRMNEP